jgi:hypothetical protein
MIYTCLCSSRIRIESLTMSSISIVDTAEDSTADTHHVAGSGSASQAHGSEFRSNIRGDCAFSSILFYSPAGPPENSKRRRCRLFTNKFLTINGTVL